MHGSSDYMCVCVCMCVCMQCVPVASRASPRISAIAIFTRQAGAALKVHRFRKIDRGERTNIVAVAGLIMEYC